MPHSLLVILAVEEPPRAARLYEGALGLRRVVDTPVYLELHGNGGVRVGLYARGGFERNFGRGSVRPPAAQVGGVELYFEVESIEAVLQSLISAGAELLSGPARMPWGDRAAYFRDPEGNVLAVAERAGGQA